MNCEIVHISDCDAACCWSCGYSIINCWTTQALQYALRCRLRRTSSQQLLTDRSQPFACLLFIQRLSAADTEPAECHRQRERERKACQADQTRGHVSEYQQFRLSLILILSPFCVLSVSCSLHYVVKSSLNLASTKLSDLHNFSCWTR